MDINTSGLTMSYAADKVIENLYFLVKDLGICQSLREYKIDDSDLPLLVEEASKVTRLLDNNPKKVEKEDMYTIYRKLM
jgi:alcohol dehydrogenase class IV